MKLPYIWHLWQSKEKQSPQVVEMCGSSAAQYLLGASLSTTTLKEFDQESQYTELFGDMKNTHPRIINWSCKLTLFSERGSGRQPPVKSEV